MEIMPSLLDRIGILVIYPTNMMIMNIMAAHLPACAVFCNLSTVFFPPFALFQTMHRLVLTPKINLIPNVLIVCRNSRCHTFMAQFVATLLNFGDALHPALHKAARPCKSPPE